MARSRPPAVAGRDAVQHRRRSRRRRPRLRSTSGATRRSSSCPLSLRGRHRHHHPGGDCRAARPLRELAPRHHAGCSAEPSQRGPSSSLRTRALGALDVLGPAPIARSGRLLPLSRGSPGATDPFLSVAPSSSRFRRPRGPHRCSRESRPAPDELRPTRTGHPPRARILSGAVRSAVTQRAVDVINLPRAARLPCPVDAALRRDRTLACPRASPKRCLLASALYRPRSCRIFPSSRSNSIGLVSNSSHPAASAFSREPGMRMRRSAR